MPHLSVDELLQRYWIGDKGPYEFDANHPYNENPTDIDAEQDLTPIRAFRTDGQMRVEGAPTEDANVLRLCDLNDFDDDLERRLRVLEYQKYGMISFDPDTQRRLPVHKKTRALIIAYPFLFK
jgi:hypothetical protein